MNTGERSEARFPEAVAQPTGHETTSTPGPTSSNYNPNMTTVNGPGNVLNYNPNINYFAYGNVAQESDALAAKITAALKDRHVPQALYRAQLGTGCMKGTRVQVLHDIDAWIKNPDAPQIFWLTGLMGTGKSAIAWTICSLAQASSEMLLGGSFFCSRSASTSAQRDVRCILPTLVQLLARQSLEFSQALAAELTRDPDILHQQIMAQIEHLLYKPLLALKTSPVPIVFVIDALDECGGLSSADESFNNAETHRLVSDMLEALVAFSRYPVKLPVKFIVTSRPETHIRDTPVSDATFSKVLQLHTVNKQQVTEDIRLYISTSLRSGPKLRSLFTEADVGTLTKLCDGLFIVARTALVFALGAGVDRAVTRLKRLLNFTQDGLSAGAAAPLDRMYALILTEAASFDEEQIDNLDDGLPNLLQMLASLLCARTTLSVMALADLMNSTVLHLRACMSHLHAVLHVPDNDSEPGLRTLHASFGDYLFGRAPSSLHIASSLGHDILARGCLHIMANQLHFNVSKSVSAHEQNLSTRPDSITLSLEYACLHWVYHVCDISESLDDVINEIFPSRFLFWLEVLSVLKRISRAAAMLIIATSTVSNATLSRFLRDGQTFVASAREAIERSAPHIYLSALPFAAKNSLVYQTFAPLCTGIAVVETLGIGPHGGRLVMTLAGHESAVLCVAYSSDGLLLASVSADGAVRVWDTRMGEEIMAPLRSSHGPIRSINFAPDVKSLVLGTEVGVICIYSLLAGQEIPRQLRGHTDAVNCITFAPDGSVFASASSDKTVRIWKTSTVQQIALHGDHESEVTSVAFSPDGMMLASGSAGFGSQRHAVRLRHGSTGIPTSNCHLDLPWIPVFGICFSPDGQHIALGCRGDVRVYEIQTGIFIASLKISPGLVRSVQYSPDGESILVVESSGDLRLWTLQRGHKSWSILVTEGALYATLSPDGLYIASASAQGSIQIWSTGSSSVAVQPLPTQPDEPISSVGITPDGSVIVSGSRNGLVCAWAAQTGKKTFSVRSKHSRASVESIAVSADGLLVAAVFGNGSTATLFVWNLRARHEIRGHGRLSHGEDRPGLTAITFSPDTMWLAGWTNDGWLYAWEIADGWSQGRCCLSLSYNMLTAVVFSPDGRLLATATCSHVQLRESGSWRQMCEIQTDNSGRISSIAFTSSGTHIATVENAAVRFWDIRTGQQTRILRVPDGLTAISPDGLLFGGQSPKYHIFVCDTLTGRKIPLLHTRTHFQEYAGFKLGSQYAVSLNGTAGKNLKIDAWNLNMARLKSAETGSLVSSTFQGGWITGPLGELLLWVPEEYRDHLQSPLHTTINDWCRVVVKPGHHHGGSWTACWREDRSGFNQESGPLAVSTDTLARIGIANFQFHAGKHGWTLFSFSLNETSHVIVCGNHIIGITTGYSLNRVFEAGFIVDVAVLSADRTVLAVASRLSKRVLVVTLQPDGIRFRNQYIVWAYDLDYIELDYDGSHLMVCCWGEDIAEEELELPEAPLPTRQLWVFVHAFHDWPQSNYLHSELTQNLPRHWPRHWQFQLLSWKHRWFVTCVRDHERISQMHSWQISDAEEDVDSHHQPKTTREDLEVVWIGKSRPRRINDYPLSDEEVCLLFEELCSLDDDQIVEDMEQVHLEGLEPFRHNATNTRPTSTNLPSSPA